VSRHAGKPVSLDPRALDLFEFARQGQHAADELRIEQLPRMLTEVAADAPARADYDPVLRWRAEGGVALELRPDGGEAQVAYLRLSVHGSVWLECQRCLEAYRQPLEVETHCRIVESDDEADAMPLDDDQPEIVVGSRRFDLMELIEEELLLSLPLVPKHDVCPQIHESLVTGAAGEWARDWTEDEDEEADEGDAADSPRPNPFAALEALKRDDGNGGEGSGGGPVSGAPH
jgi:uncharacterized protein